MKRSLSRATKALMFALAASSFSFAGPGLADGFAKFVGNITTRGQVRSDFGTYWNQITAENECKWASIEGSRGNYNFSGCDAAYNWAKNNGGHFKFHALVWGSQYPNWLNGLSAADTKTAITNWFDRVKKQYPDLEMIDVVNEAIRGGNGYHSGYGNGNNIPAALGGDNGDYKFVVTAFQMARDRWPDAILIYNDYNTVQWDKDGGINLINTIKKGGAPVDAYGLQAHDMTTQGGGAGGTGGGGGCLNINTLKNTINEIWEKTQMPMFISEYDISIADDNSQKQCYQDQISFFMENEHIAGITIWGYIYGATWIDHSGIIKDGQDRAAMKWLKEYFGNEANKAKSQNSTGLAGGKPVDPEPRQYFKGNPFEIPGKIEMEDFDISGKGKNEDGTSNITYSENDSDNHSCTDAGKEAECSNYREDAPGVDLYKKATGVVLGYVNAGEWLEYTINVKEAGDYTFFAAVTSGGGSSFNFTLDGKELTGDIKVPANSDADNYDDYNKVSKNVTLPAGQHVLRFTAVEDWMDIDYITFVKGKDATDPEPIASSSDSGNGGTDIFVQKRIEYDPNALQHYRVIDTQGHYMGILSGYGFDAATDILQHSTYVKSSGVYFLINRYTGEMKSVRVTR